MMVIKINDIHYNHFKIFIIFTSIYSLYFISQLCPAIDTIFDEMRIDIERKINNRFG